MSDKRPYRTAGSLRAAAFHICHPEHAPNGQADPVGLHDSLCGALPSNSETPASVSYAAAELLDALKTARDYVSDALDGHARESLRHVRLAKMARDDLTNIDAAIAKATGS
jgi:hypothetical protein